LYSLGSVIIPGNAESIVSLASGFSSVNTTTKVEFRINWTNGTATQFMPCVSILATSDGSQDVVSCVLPRGLLAQATNASFSLQVTRAGLTLVSNVGTVGPALFIESRPQGAKVAKSAGYYLLPSPVTQEYFVKNYGYSLLSAITANVYVTSAKRNIHANETTSVNCTVTRFFGDFLVCSVSKGTDSENPILASGLAWANIDVRGYSLSFQISLGTVTDGPSVTPTVSSKVAMAQGTEITIQGTSFAVGTFARTDNAVTLAYRYTYSNNGVPSSGDTTLPCSVIEASESFLICNATSQLFSTTGTTLSAVVTSWGSDSASNVIGTLVPLAQINIWRERVNITDPKININGTNFSDNLASNRVRVSRDVNPRIYTSCDVIAAESRSDTLVCNLPNTDLVTKEGDRLVFSVYANGAWSPETSGIVGLSNSDSQTRDNIGVAVGISAAILVVILIVVLVIILLVRRRNLQDIKGQLHKVPEAFASMFNIKTSDLEIVSKLGEGSFGAVFLAKYKSPKGEKKVAVKKLTSSMLASSVDGFFREAVRPLGHRDVSWPSF
jgi:hypothetical protein